MSERPAGDFPKDIPTQEEFESVFATPVDFGEEGDWLLVSKNLSAEAALALLQKTLRDDWGLDEEYIPQTEDDLGIYDVGWGYDYDSYHYSEGGYWICLPQNQITPRFKAWGVATQ